MLAVVLLIVLEAVDAVVLVDGFIVVVVLVDGFMVVVVVVDITVVGFVVVLVVVVLVVVVVTARKKPVKKIPNHSEMCHALQTPVFISCNTSGN